MEKLNSVLKFNKWESLTCLHTNDDQIVEITVLGDYFSTFPFVEFRHLIIPIRHPIYLCGESMDVNHYLFIQRININFEMEVVPFRTNTQVLYLMETGDYIVRCLQPCTPHPVIIHAVTYDQYLEFLIARDVQEISKVMERICN